MFNIYFHLHHHYTHEVLSSHIPQVLPNDILINPYSPQRTPQEFFNLKLSNSIPTSNTSWLSYLPQSLKMPEWYLTQLVASTATLTGLLNMAAWSSVHPSTLWTFVILKSPPFDLHSWSLPVYGYCVSVYIPLSATYESAW